MEVLSGLEHLSLESTLPYIITAILITLIGLLGGYFKFIATSHPGKRLAPGSFGFPIIGETISFLRAYKKGGIHEWFQERIDKYGPAFKTSLVGFKAMVITGQAGNRFIFSEGNHGLTANQPVTLKKVFGKKSLLELSGTSHKLVRSALTNFLKPESIQRFVSEMDLIVQQQLIKELHGKDSVKMVPLMKEISFKVSCSLLFGIPEGKEKDALFKDFFILFKGIYTIPLDFPGTTFHKAMQARGRICKQLSDLIRRRREEIENGQVGPENIISSFLNLRDENGEHFTEEMILDNLILMIIASHDTITVLLSFFIRELARNPEVYDKVLEEQKEVLKASKERDGKLTWSEIQMMKYTWRVAQELMRLRSPVFGNSRCCTKDTTFEGFDIPKGWQVFWVSSPTHMDEKIFEEPEKFDPSRFESSSRSFPSYTYIPFGAGPRICPGSEYARIEILLIIHHLITNYRWTEMIANEPITCQPAPFPEMGLPVKLHPRQASPISI